MTDTDFEKFDEFSIISDDDAHPYHAIMSCFDYSVSEVVWLKQFIEKVEKGELLINSVDRYHRNAALIFIEKMRYSGNKPGILDNKLLRKLIDLGMDIDMMDIHGNNLFKQSIILGNEMFTRYLMSKNVNPFDFSGCTGIDKVSILLLDNRNKISEKLKTEIREYRKKYFESNNIVNIKPVKRS